MSKCWCLVLVLECIMCNFIFFNLFRVFCATLLNAYKYTCSLFSNLILLSFSNGSWCWVCCTISAPLTSFQQVHLLRNSFIVCISHYWYSYVHVANVVSRVRGESNTKFQPQPCCKVLVDYLVLLLSHGSLTYTFYIFISYHISIFFFFLYFFCKLPYIYLYLHIYLVNV